MTAALKQVEAGRKAEDVAREASRKRSNPAIADRGAGAVTGAEAMSR